MTLAAPYEEEHRAENLNGPGDSRPTAMKIVQDQNLIGKLAGKTTLVTGCTSGLGVETARALHATGADVYMQVRNIDRGIPVQKDILSDSGPGKVELIEMSLDSFDSIRKGAADFLSKNKTLNILINNAGTMANPEGRTQDGFETQFGTNHLGHFLLFQLLKSALLAGASTDFSSRVISVSSTGHRQGKIHFDDFNMTNKYDPWTAYGQSKLANIHFASELDRRYGSKGLHAFSLMPGGIATPLQKHMGAGSMEAAAKDPELGKLIKSIPQGAATSIWAALGKEWEGKGGKYFEDCQESYPDTGEGGPLRMGYSPLAFNEENEKRLWTESLKLVGVQDD